MTATTATALPTPARDAFAAFEADAADVRASFVMHRGNDLAALPKAELQAMIPGMRGTKADLICAIVSMEWARTDTAKELAALADEAADEAKVLRELRAASARVDGARQRIRDLTEDAPNAHTAERVLDATVALQTAVVKARAWEQVAYAVREHDLTPVQAARAVGADALARVLSAARYVGVSSSVTSNLASAAERAALADFANDYAG